MLGYRYPGDSRPLRIGDYAVIRTGTVIYANTTIGHRFQCGHHVVIRAEVTIGDRCVVHHQCTLEGRIRIGDGVKIMAHVYVPSTTVIGPDAAILIPPVARAIDWEGELAVVIGRRAKGVAAGQARRYVAGYTIMNDVSERQLQIRQRTASRPRDEWFDWLNGKWLDTFAPQGPWLVTADELTDPQAVTITTRVHGERRQHSSTAQMLCPVDQIIEYLSAIVTLEPGDLISTGTVAGVGATTGTFLKPGDRVEIEIDGIGVLRNRVAASRR